MKMFGLILIIPVSFTIFKHNAINQVLSSEF